MNLPSNNPAPPPPEELPVGGPQPLAAADVLPPVRPPSASFLMQLFFIPLIIVSIIVVVWLLFSWLAHLGTRPQELVRDLEALNHASWQRALTLANLLRDPRNEELRRDTQLAQQLASLLQRQLDEGRTDQDRIWLRLYLCRALGEFQVTDGLPVLRAAATHERDPAEIDVRRAAVQAIALLCDRVGPEQVLARPDVLRCLFRAAALHGDAQDAQPARGELRSNAAFALGLIGGPQTGDHLATMLADPYPNARYNAATGLARLGDPRAVPRLVEMLQIDNPDAIRFETDRSQQRWKQELVLLNALRAVQLLAAGNQQVDLASLSPAIESLLQADLGPAVELQARDALRELRERPPANPPPGEA